VSHRVKIWPFHGSDGSSDNAYGMYLVHYVFVVWVQYTLLEPSMLAVTKAAPVFGVTLLLSWTVCTAIRGVPLGSRFVGEAVSAD
jgi:surface polysaccharide O-acyltransferase-like enzyme